MRIIIYAVLLCMCNALLAIIVPSGSGFSIISSSVITLSGTYKLANNIIEGSIIVAADNVILDLNEKIMTNENDACIEITDRRDITIKNGFILDSSTGILINTSTHIVMQDITFNNDVTGIACNSFVENSVIANNIFENCNTGITMIDSSKNVIMHNTFARLFLGMSIANSSRIVIADNVAADFTGIALNFTTNESCVIKNNIISSCSISGMQCSGLTFSVITDNQAYQCATGILLDSGSPDNVVLNNICEQNTVGIEDQTVTELNEIFYNIASGNTTNYVGVDAGLLQIPGASPIVVGSNIDN